MYEYAAKVTKIVDGDTVDIELDLGFHITITQRCRLRGINCPETRGSQKEAGLSAKQYTQAWITATDNAVVIRSHKPYSDDKYGRFLVEIFPTKNASHIKIDAPTNAESLNNALLRTAMAIPYMVED